MVGVLRFVTSTRNADRFILVGLLLAIGFAVGALLLVYVSNRMYFRSILVPVAEIRQRREAIAGTTE